MRDKKISKKELRNQVFKKMETALEDMRGEADAKKFSKKIKKVSDWLADEIAKTAKKPATPKVKPAGKAKVSGARKSPSKLPVTKKG
ncbi:hypothetical protein [Agriterribacter sp.]|uniref:hypothetical protein n=1 Tax=Agriterribacter sp. TaxID=2821509 RepID=UPI002BF10CFD|nr:hypothetical protein [Agriterribacter sp.]HRO45456.1 hypothetical protein [Agriterribacter sp.]HRQ19173.1 hypothetical protein [Agriterribacter sp.]